MNLSLKKRRLGISRPSSGFQNNVIKETKSFGHPLGHKQLPLSPTLCQNGEKEKKDGCSLLFTTPRRRSKMLESCDDSPVNYDDSPTLAVVTWDNGYQYDSNAEDFKMRANLKRGNRCKQFHRVSKSMPTENTVKTAPENLTEFSKYMEWAKSFMDENETALRERVTSSPQYGLPVDGNAETNPFTNFLDDSSDEAMLASSQAAENEFWEKWKSDASAKENELPPHIRKLVTPTAQGGMPLRKRLRIDEPSDGIRRNNVARILYPNGSGDSNNEQNRATQSSFWSAKESRVNVTNTTNRSLARSNTADDITTNRATRIRDGNMVPSTRLSTINNNDAVRKSNSDKIRDIIERDGDGSKNYSIRRVNSDNSSSDGTLMRENSTTAKPTLLRVPPIDGRGCIFAPTSSRNPLKAHSGVRLSLETNKNVGRNADSFLDDGMDVFESLDFNFIDSLNEAGKVTKSRNVAPVTTVQPTTTRYSKEEILRRRQEAKKKLASKFGQIGR